MYAHHFIDNKNPVSLFDGFISGVAHPVIGLDHLIFLVFISILTLMITRNISYICTFIIATILGSFLTVVNLNIPGLELFIILSIIALSLIFFIYQKISTYYLKIFLYPFLVLFGLFHGNAYGNTITESPFFTKITYITGFCLSQLIICFLCFYIAKFIVAPNNTKSIKPYLAGSLNFVLGWVMLFNYL